LSTNDVKFNRESRCRGKLEWDVGEWEKKANILILNVVHEPLVILSYAILVTKLNAKREGHLFVKIDKDPCKKVKFRLLG
jgi:hypothetical protein